MSRNNLFFREWFVVFVVFLSGALIFLSSSSYSFDFAKEHFYKIKSPQSVRCRKKILVDVSGEVDSPGVYEVEVGTSVKSILEQAGVKSSADKRTYQAKKILLSSCKIHIFEKKNKKSKKKEEKKIALR